MLDKSDMKFWYQYMYDEVKEQSDEQMRFIFKVHNYAKDIGDEELDKMCQEFYRMRMERDM